MKINYVEVEYQPILDGSNAAKQSYVVDISKFDLVDLRKANLGSIFEDAPESSNELIIACTGVQFSQFGLILRILESNEHLNIGIKITDTAIFSQLSASLANYCAKTLKSKLYVPYLPQCPIPWMVDNHPQFDGVFVAADVVDFIYGESRILLYELIHFLKRRYDRVVIEGVESLSQAKSYMSWGCHIMGPVQNHFDFTEK